MSTSAPRRPPRARRRAAAVLTVALAAVAAACGPPGPPAPTPAPNPLTLGHGGVLANASASGASISADGRWVAFTSSASNLVSGDSGTSTDLFLRDRSIDAVYRIRELVSGAPRISANGRYISYQTQGLQLGVYDRVTQETKEWAPNVSNSIRPVVPPDGSVAIYGAYSSFGIFATACRVRELSTGVESNCPPGGPDYGTVAFEGASANGRFVVYYWLDQSGGGTSARLLWDRELGTTTVLDPSIISFGSSVSVSGDGRYLATVTFSSGIPFDPVVHDLWTGTSVSPPGPAPDGNSFPVEISADGSTVLVLSEATNLVPDDTNGAADAFLWHVDSGAIERISLTVPDGEQLPTGAFSCGQPGGQILADGSAGCVLTAEPVVAGDTNGVTDAYLLG